MLGRTRDAAGELRVRDGSRCCAGDAARAHGRSRGGCCHTDELPSRVEPYRRCRVSSRALTVAAGRIPDTEDCLQRRK